MQAQAERAKQQLFEANLAGADGGLPVLMSDENPDAIIMISDTGIIQYTNLVSSSSPILLCQGWLLQLHIIVVAAQRPKSRFDQVSKLRHWASCQWLLEAQQKPSGAWPATAQRSTPRHKQRLPTSLQQGTGALTSAGSYNCASPAGSMQAVWLQTWRADRQERKQPHATTLLSATQCHPGQIQGDWQGSADRHR